MLKCQHVWYFNINDHVDCNLVLMQSSCTRSNQQLHSLFYTSGNKAVHIFLHVPDSIASVPRWPWSRHQSSYTCSRRHDSHFYTYDNNPIKCSNTPFRICERHSNSLCHHLGDPLGTAFYPVYAQHLSRRKSLINLKKNRIIYILLYHLYQL